MLKNFFQSTWKIKICKNQTISELYTDGHKQTFSNLKKNYERLYTKETTSKADTTQFLSKIQIERKYLMSNLIFVR